MRPETVLIETDNGPVMINKSDFDPNTQKLHDPNAAVQPVPEPVPAEPAAVDANGNPVNPGDGGQLVPPAQQPQTNEGEQQTPPPAQTNTTMLVTKKNKKFIVVNDKGEPVERDGIDAAGYPDEAAAWAAVTAVTLANNA